MLIKSKRCAENFAMSRKQQTQGWPRVESIHRQPFLHVEYQPNVLREDLLDNK